MMAVSVSLPPAALPARGLVRVIGRWDLLAALVNGIIGSAIFGLPSDLAALTGARSPLAYLFAGLGMLTIVLCFAEVGSRFDAAGGPYLYAREAFGGAVGFQAGWLTIWIRVTALAANLNVFVNYLAQVLPAAGAGWGRGAVMLGVIGLIALLNVRGVRQATFAVDAFTVAKVLPLLMLIVIGLPQIRSEVLETQLVVRPQWREAILLLVFAYGGFETPLIPAGEVRRPRQDTAFALLLALGLVAGVYMLVQLVVIGVVPEVARSEAPVAAAFQALLGTPGLAVASLAAMLSVYGWTVGSVLQSPRLLFAMAERSELPAFLGRVHPRFRTPDVAILVYCALALALALYGSFQWNALLSAIVRLVAYALTCVALLVFRHRPAPLPGFRLPGAELVAPLGTLFCVWLLSTRNLAQAGVLLALVAVGALLRWSSGGRRAAAAG
jgi:amino acid transporter